MVLGETFSKSSGDAEKFEFPIKGRFFSDGETDEDKDTPYSDETIIAPEQKKQEFEEQIKTELRNTFFCMLSVYLSSLGFIQDDENLTRIFSDEQYVRTLFEKISDEQLEVLEEYNTLADDDRFSAILDPLELTDTGNTNFLYALCCAKGHFVKAIDAIKRLFENEPNIISEGLGTQTTELADDQISPQLQYRQRYFERLIEIFGIDDLALAKMFYPTGGVGAVDLLQLNPEDEESKEMKEFFGTSLSFSHTPELQIALSGLILSPNMSTEELIGKINSIIADSYIKENTQKVDSFYKENWQNLHLLAKIGLHIAMGTGNFQPFGESKVFEVGGDDAVRAFEALGAKIIIPAEAGHNYFAGSGSGMVSDESKLIHLGNYHQFAEPHSADVVCSAQLFDLGSGIEKISGYEIGTELGEKYGGEEMALVMRNIVKDGGFMIHDAYPPEKLFKKLGINRVAILLYDIPGNNRATIYRVSGERRIERKPLNKKKTVFRGETGTWELAK